MFLNEWLKQHVTEVEYPTGFKSSNRMFIFAYNEIFPGWSRIALENYIKTVYLIDYGIKEERVDTTYGSMTATEVVIWFKVHDPSKEEQELAAAIHGKLCRYNHEDQCDWFYGDRWDQRFTAKHEYLKKARAMLDNGVEFDQAMKVISHF